MNILELFEHFSNLGITVKEEIISKKATGIK